MHKTILKLFSFLKSCTQFIKILIVFYIILLLMYWTQNLLEAHWNLLDFAVPTLKFFVDAGALISQNSINLFDAVFEYKYFHALIIFLLLFGLDHVIYLGLIKLEEFYEDSRALAKKVEEKALNMSLKNDFENKQRQLKTYVVYISAEVKQKLNNNIFNINLDEELQKMNKFLIEQTMVSPQKFENGFLYRFESFHDIDNTLDVLMKILHSESPLDYVICIQVISKNESQDIENLKYLISLKTENAITAFSETVLRYGYNKIRKYKTMQQGLFQKSGNTFEVHKFTE